MQASPPTGQVRAGGRHPVAQFHPYHTKVPPLVIRKRIERFTAPGELVLDPFSGSGMTGVAALDCGRRAVLSDLSPAASFVSSVNTRAYDVRRVRAVLEAALDGSERELGHLYRSGADVVDYYVWSDVFTCPTCCGAFPFFDAGVDHLGTKVRTRRSFACPHCGDPGLNIRRVSRVLDREWRKQKALVWVSGRGPQGRLNRGPYSHDVALAQAAEQVRPQHWTPDVSIDVDAYSARLAQLGAKGIRHVNDLLSRRNLCVFSDLWQRVNAGADADADTAAACRAVLTGAFTTVSERQGYFGGGGGMSGNLYMPVVRMEKNVHVVVRRRLGLLDKAEAHKARWTTSAVPATQSATALALRSGSVDYVYTDPPFGANMIYSELNLALEAWLGGRSQAELEVVMDPSRGWDAGTYAERLGGAFVEVARVLRPGRAVTVQFHNSDEGTWGALQSALDCAGLSVEQIDVLDKGATTLLSDIRPNSVSQDLLIDARRRQPARSAPEAQSTQELEAVLTRILVEAPSDLAGEKLRQYAYSALVAQQLREGRVVAFTSNRIYALLSGLGVRASQEKEGRVRPHEKELSWVR